MGAFDLLLVTDISPLEFIWGKLGGVFYVAKEMILLPAVLAIYLCIAGALTLENLVYMLGGLAVMNLFVATLGIHAGLTYTNSRSAVAVSLGTVFFLFVGVATCMRIMISFSGSFQLQLAPFLAFMIGGSAGVVRGLGGEKSVAGDRVGVAVIAGADVRGHHRLLAGRNPGSVLSRRLHLRPDHDRDARPGHLRIRRRHRPHYRMRGGEIPRARAVP